VPCCWVRHCNLARGLVELIHHGRQDTTQCCLNCDRESYIQLAVGSAGWPARIIKSIPSRIMVISGAAFPDRSELALTIGPIPHHAE
jgi:hypothetical protein